MVPQKLKKWFRLTGAGFGSGTAFTSSCWAVSCWAVSRWARNSLRVVKTGYLPGRLPLGKTVVQDNILLVRG